MHYLRGMFMDNDPTRIPLRSGVASSRVPVLPCGSNITSFSHSYKTISFTYENTSLAYW